MKTNSFFLFLLAAVLAPWSSMAQLFRDRESREKFVADSTSAEYYYHESYRYWQQNADSVLFFAELSLKAARSGGYRVGEAQALLSAGVGYFLKEDNVRALDSYLQALRINEKLDFPLLNSYLYNNIGTVYAGMGEYRRSNEYFQQSLAILRKEKQESQRSTTLTNIADNFKNLRQYDSALYYNFLALPIAEAGRDSVLIAAILLNTGEDYCQMRRLQDARGYFERCQKIARLIHDEQDIAWADVSLADVCLRKGDFRRCILLARRALQSAQHYSFAEIVRKSYSMLYSGYSGLKRYEMAIRYRNREIAWRDSLYGIEKDKKVTQLQSSYDLEKKQLEIEMLNQKSMLQEREVQTERERHFVFAGAALFFSLWAIFLYRGNWEMRRLNRRAGNQTTEITDI